MDEEYKVRVIVAGGGVSGLTLANALEVPCMTQKFQALLKQ